MKYLLDIGDPAHAAALDLLRCGAVIREDAEDRLVLERDGLFCGAGRVDRSALFGDALMALCLDEAPAKALFASGRFESMTGCVQYVYLKDPPEKRLPAGVNLRRLTEEDVPFLCANYHHPSATPRHIRERIAAYMVGAFIEGQCAGFAGIHEEDSIGMLEVLPAYRHRGIARALESELIRRQLSVGRIPYAQVKLGNTVSMRLQESLGFTASEAPVYWLCKDTAYTAANLT